MFFSKKKSSIPFKFGQRIAVFGPNYIWTGTYVDESKDTVTLTDVNQLFETGPHTTVETEHERICDTMVFFKTAICNIGDPIWIADANAPKTII